MMSLERLFLPIAYRAIYDKFLNFSFERVDNVFEEDGL